MPESSQSEWENWGTGRVAIFGLTIGVFFGLHFYFVDGTWWVGVISGTAGGLLTALFMLLGVAWARRQQWEAQDWEWARKPAVILLAAAFIGSLQFKESRFDHQSTSFSVLGAVVMAVATVILSLVGREMRRRRPLKPPSRPDEEISP